MRYRVPMALSLSLALLATGGFTRAGEPAGSHKHKPRHLCTKCQLEKAIQESGGRPLIIEGPSQESLAQANMTIVGGSAPCIACQGQPMAAGADSAGYASLGQSAPGYASLGRSGLQMAQHGNEPMPIGVVRTNFNNPPAQAPVSGVAFDPTHGMPRNPGMAHGAGMAPGYQQASTIGTLDMSSHRKPRVLTHLFGLEGIRFGGRREAREAAEASSHAAIPMGMPGPAVTTDLPASMVYGRR